MVPHRYSVTYRNISIITRHLKNKRAKQTKTNSNERQTTMSPAETPVTGRRGLHTPHTESDSDKREKVK